MAALEIAYEPYWDEPAPAPPVRRWAVVCVCMSCRSSGEPVALRVRQQSRHRRSHAQSIDHEGPQLWLHGEVSFVDKQARQDDE